MFGSEIAAKLAEIKRLSNVAATIAPARRSESLDLSLKELEMIEDLLKRLNILANELIENVSAQIKEANIEPAGGQLTSCDHDVVSALLNLGCGRPQAELAVRKAKAGGVPADFEPLFRRALKLIR